METIKPYNFRRRRLFMQMMTAGLFGAAGANFIRHAFAAEGALPQGVQRFEGTVTVNGKPATVGMQVAPGDSVNTDKGSYAVIVMRNNAFLLRENTAIQFGGKVKEAAPYFLRLLTGKLLSVFGPGNKRIETPTATAGIRGTGLYLEAQPERTYICLCYGSMELSPIGKDQQKETITTTHHGDPRFVTAAGTVERAPVINHTDAELFLLEESVGRVPPFTGQNTGTYY